MSCVWDHAHDVLRRELELCFTVDILLHDSMGLQSMVSNPSTSCCMYETMRINECVVEHKTVQRLKKVYYIIHCSFILLVSLYCALLCSEKPNGLVTWIDLQDDHRHVLRRK